MAFTLWLATRALMRCCSWEPPRQTSSHPPSQTTHNFHPYGWMIRILTFHSNFLSALAGSYIYLGGEVSLCIWGISQRLCHFPNKFSSLPQQFASFPQQNCFISPTTWVTSPTTCVTSPTTHFLISPTTLCHFAPRQKILIFKKKILVFISQYPCITLKKAKPFLSI